MANIANARRAGKRSRAHSSDDGKDKFADRNTFEENWMPYAEAGLVLVPVPVGQKHPAIKGWNTGKNALPMTAPKARMWIESGHGGDNIGLVTGAASRLSIVDVDVPTGGNSKKALHDALALFGDTPMIAQTPSGGWHLYYLFNGERCRNLRNLGLSIDIKAQGGFVMLPPSVTPDGRQYSWHTGGPDLLREGVRPLPVMNAGGIPKGASRGATVANFPGASGGIVPIGTRDNHLFRTLAAHVARNKPSSGLLDIKAVIARANEINTLDMAAPLTESEVMGRVKSVVKYAQQGNLYDPDRGRAAVLLPEEQAVILAASNALEARVAALSLALFTRLLQEHSARVKRGETFCIAARAMEQASVIPGWSRRNYDEARRWLLRCGVLIEVKSGGRYKGDAAEYQLARLCVSHGTNSYPNVIDTPPPITNSKPIEALGSLAKTADRGAA